jgi:hypothetical protein
MREIAAIYALSWGCLLVVLAAVVCLLWAIWDEWKNLR